MREPVEAVVFDVGRVLYQWDLRCLFAPLIAEAALAIEEERFETFRDEVAEAGGWPPALEQLANALMSLRRYPGGHADG